MSATYKILGQAAPANTSNATIYTVPSATYSVTSTIHICNVTGVAATASIYTVRSGETASNANAIARTISIPGNGFLSMTIGATLGAGEFIVVNSGTANSLTFTVFGSEVD